MIDKVAVFKNSHFSDLRGDLWTIWDESIFEPKLKFNLDKVAKSKKNVLRGLHGDNKSWKLVTCLYGEFLLCTVDYRQNSESFLKNEFHLLTSENKKSVLVPPMFLNGHLVLSDECVFHYKWSFDGKYPDIDEQFSVRWDDPILNIKWPIEKPILSERDKNSNFI